MHAQTIEAAEWWAKSRGETSATWIANYQRSLKSRHRDRIVEIVKGLHAETLLEGGCHCGPNLVRLAHECPALQMIGLDANSEAVQAGRAWLATAKLADRIQLNVGRVPDDTWRLPDQAFDVVLSCYTTAYVAPSDLDAVLYDLGRLASRAVILAEPMTEHETSEYHGTLQGYQEWAHNYARASRWLNTWRGMTLRTVAVDPPVDRLRQILVAVRD